LFNLFNLFILLFQIFFSSEICFITKNSLFPVYHS
jgi:hypothetical protein